jgi:hypothetical protein
MCHLCTNKSRNIYVPFMTDLDVVQSMNKKMATYQYENTGSMVVLDITDSFMKLS